MKITFEPAARDDLDRIFEWLFKENPRVAYETIVRIEAKLGRLVNPQLAHMGRPGLVEGTRELIEYPYIIVYTVRDDLGEIVVISVVHGARDRKEP
jgi:plasmid stabilization system protein ParE